MEDIVKLISSIKEKKDVTAEQLSDKILSLIPAYTNDTYAWTGYLGHHSVVISKNLRELLSGPSSGQSKKYDGLNVYTGELESVNADFQYNYNAVKEALKTEIDAEGHRGNNPAYVDTFKDIAYYSLSELTKLETITPGQYFYLYNSLKNTREEFIDDFI